jgi:DNA polymerase-3 subunit gamma/tau
VLHGLLWNSVHLLRFEPGVIEIRAPGCPRDFASRLMELLGKWTGRRWVVSLSDQAQGEPTLAQQVAAVAAARKAKAAEHPLVRRVLELFPGATLEAVRGPAEPEPTSEPPMPEDGMRAADVPPHESDVIPDTIDLENDEP